MAALTITKLHLQDFSTWILLPIILGLRDQCKKQFFYITVLSKSESAFAPFFLRGCCSRQCTSSKKFFIFCHPQDQIVIKSVGQLRQRSLQRNKAFRFHSKKSCTLSSARLLKDFSVSETWLDIIITERLKQKGNKKFVILSIML